MSDSTFSFDTIALRNLQFRCIIGLYPRERREAQPIEMDLELDLSIERAVISHCLEETVDYSALVDELGFLLDHAQFDLLETAGHAICHFVLGYRPLDRRRGQIEQVRLSLRKPKALNGSAYPELILKRCRAQVLHAEPESQGIKHLHENANCTLMQVDLNPGEKISFSMPEYARCYILSWSHLQELEAGLQIPRGKPHQLTESAVLSAESGKPASFFCVLRWHKKLRSRLIPFFYLNHSPQVWQAGVELN